MLQYMELQRVRYNWATEQLNNWTTTTHVSAPSQAWHLLWHVPFEWGKGAHGFLSGHFTLWSQGHMISCLGTSLFDLKVTWFSVWELHPLISRSHGFLSGNFTLWSQGHMVSYLVSLSDLKVTWFSVPALHPLISRSHGFLSGHFTLWSQGHTVSCLGTSPSDLKVTWFSVWALHPLISRSHGFLSGHFTLWSQGHMVYCLGTSPSHLKVTWFPVWALHSLILRSHGFLSGNFTLWSQGQRTEHHPWGRAGRCSSLGRGNLRSWTSLPREASTLPETPFMSFLMLPS